MTYVEVLILASLAGCVAGALGRRQTSGRWTLGISVITLLVLLATFDGELLSDLL